MHCAYKVRSYLYLPMSVYYLPNVPLCVLPILSLFAPPHSLLFPMCP